MSYMFVLGRCASCESPMTFNAERVPSVVVDGVREPICLRCVNEANPKRIAEGLPKIEVLPGAYEPEEV
jgi:hypothetical protein